jgi:indole-3-glycerol phosphate synthase
MRLGVRTRKWGMLDKILTPKRAEVARMLAAPALAARRAPGGGAIEALTRGPGEPLRLIAEIKHRSPSAGPLSVALTPADRALAYAATGARAISILTDRPFFDGGFEHLAAARDALDAALGAKRPRLLCKEFVIHEIQLDRAVDAGADLVLLIARIVPPERLSALVEAARTRGLEPLVEVATLAEVEDAFVARAAIIGVNARDLNTLKMDADRAAGMLAAIGDRAIAVHLSGLGKPDDVARVAAGTAQAALIGEALMREDDPRGLLGEMVRAAG